MLGPTALHVSVLLPLLRTALDEARTGPPPILVATSTSTHTNFALTRSSIVQSHSCRSLHCCAALWLFAPSDLSRLLSPSCSRLPTRRHAVRAHSQYAPLVPHRTHCPLTHLISVLLSPSVFSSTYASTDFDPSGREQLSAHEVLCPCCYTHDLSNRDVLLQKALFLSQFLRLFMIIDGVFLVLWALLAWPFFIGLLLIIMGFYGVKYYNTALSSMVRRPITYRLSS